MTGCLQLDEEGQWAPPDGGQELLASLDRAFGPAVLLRFETIHVYRQLRRGHHIGQENKSPARKLGSIAKIEILAQGVVLPAAGLLDADAPPQAGRPVEIEKTSTPAPRRLFQQQVAIQKHRLHAREQGIAAIQMSPARLDHANLWIGEKMNGTLEEIARRHEVGV